jgi:translocation protein SEC62
VAKALFRRNYFLRVDKVEKSGGRQPKKAKTLMRVKVSKDRQFEASAYYIWLYDEPSSRIGTAVCVAGLVALTCYSLWPPIWKANLWHVSVTALIVIFCLLLARILLSGVAWLLGWQFWLLPRLLDETTVSWGESFSPLVFAERNQSDSYLCRGAAVLGIAGLVQFASAELQLGLNAAMVLFVAECYNAGGYYLKRSMAAYGIFKMIRRWWRR